MADETTAGFRSLDGVKVMEKTANSVTLEFSIPSSSPYFNGHFPEFPILPAVAQVELVIRLASEYLGTGIDISEIRRIKFSNFFKPDNPHLLRIDKKEDKGERTLSFKVFSPASDTVFSSGVMVTSENRCMEDDSSPKESAAPLESL